MTTARLFTNGGSQAVRLPKGFRFEDDEVLIAKVGEVVVLYPRSKGWGLMAEGIARFSADFLTDRQQPSAPEDRAPL